MKPSSFKYHDPRSKAEVLTLLREKENSKILAGGQSLGPMLNFRFVMPDHLIDLNRVSGLDFISITDQKIRIGAMTRQKVIERSDQLKQVCPVFAEGLQWVGHYATRNRGTIGGSLSHLDPAAELPGICLLYDAALRVESADGHRSVSAADWSVSFMTPNLQAEELLTEIEFAPWQVPHGYAFAEFSRRHGDFAIAGVGCLVALDTSGLISRIAMSVVGVSSTPCRLIRAEADLVGHQPDDKALAVVNQAIAELEASSDAQTSAQYRKRIASVLMSRALKQAVDRAVAAVQ